MNKQQERQWVTLDTTLSRIRDWFHNRGVQIVRDDNGFVVLRDGQETSGVQHPALWFAYIEALELFERKVPEQTK